ncbi:hypothetical protein BGZ73_008511 [Actinomortierella ambigua]|nr:hypothetical protein BGZ73_008511 [Actinomortierella ambigua]
MAGLFDNNSMNCAINNMPLDNFASTTVSASHDSNVIAVCLAQDQSTQASKCYVYTTYNCARKLAGACGSGACERTCRVGNTDEHTSFVREMMYYNTPSSSSSGVPAGPNTTPASTQAAKTGSADDNATIVVGDEDDAQESKPLNKRTKNATATTMDGASMKNLGSETTEKVNPTTTTTTTTTTGGANALPAEVQTTLTITSNDDKKNVWYGFIADGALFLRGDGWGDMEIRESIVAVLELAEEQLGCDKVYLCLEKSHPDLADLVRALMYADFQMVHPGVLPNADPKYLVLGI